MPFRIRRALLAATAMLPAALLSSLPAQAASAEPVRVYAAGSLRAVMGKIAKAYEAAQGIPVAGTFGASGLLKERLEKGEAADVFASANMEHPRALHAAGLAEPVRAFARNTLCALTKPGLTITPDTLLDRMLDPAVRLGTSTPKNDPAGDYAWELFAKADMMLPGSGAALDAKAIEVTGGPQAPQPPEGRNAYAWLMERDAADLILTYCTNARLATREIPALGVVAVPEPLSVGAEYGITLMTRDDATRGRGFVDFVLSPPGQTILQRHGFQPPAR
ncbi:molybdate ABC transporter substrate-binding protein [Azospirillum sp. TSH7]|uniref:molybdate ABC transporter substrate-binding protein n=1 Tax=unclassified Azospirillum TaxID=2630922 RepID=UPI000D603B97|nr:MULTISPECIES: molybdate ABC transporter substrate-binding protein [unclassified Azospirillum]PWC57040.1 molybdate ABC transporter substrate-binding protein [Azospirillum sp. TSH7]PWC65160.1 molybdate ABC transporter substrate-binding protein [Azospirillum sp. TSH20]